MSSRLVVLAVCVITAVGSGAPASAIAGPATPPAEPRYRVTGHLTMVEKGKPARDRSLDLTHAAVWFEPARNEGAPRPTTAEMLTVRKQFQPQLVVVPVGSSVRFPNQDPILHNVFSVSGQNSFDLGLVGSGSGKSVRFREAGLVRVFCNVHHAMFAHVLVVATPYYAQVDERGDFALDGLPAGAGEIHFWHERGDASSLRLDLPHAGAVALELEVTQPRVPPHRNKFGKTYARGAYD